MGDTAPVLVTFVVMMMTGATISDHKSVNGITFVYHEVKTSDAGGGPRGIEVNWEGHAGGGVRFYPINPNPHVNTAYNKNQADFYRAACQMITQGVPRETSRQTFPLLKSGERPPTIKGPAWTKMSKAQQQKAINDYNEKQQEKKREADREALDRGVQDHLNNKHHQTFEWNGEHYTLP